MKHNNPCGAAVGGSLADAYGRAFESDTVSAFGGIVAFNRRPTRTPRARWPTSSPRSSSHQGSPKAPSPRSARGSPYVSFAPLPAAGGLDVRALPGRALVQDRDVVAERREDMEIVSDREPTEDEWRDLLFTWTVAMRVKSNAIVFARDRATVGVGAGQMSRGLVVPGRPQGGGSREGRRDGERRVLPLPRRGRGRGRRRCHGRHPPGRLDHGDDVLSVAESRGMAVVVTGRRHFRH